MVEKKLDVLKFEVAKELGLAEKVLKFGWKSLTAKETGKIGGMVSKRRKSMQEAETGQM